MGRFTWINEGDDVELKFYFVAPPTIYAPVHAPDYVTRYVTVS